MSQAEMDRPPTYKEVLRVRQHECRLGGHSWDVVQDLDHGPIAVICSNCGQDSGLRRANQLEEET